MRRLTDDAPRVDALGKHTVKEVFDRLGIDAPQGNTLYSTALAGEIITNSLYFSQIGGRRGMPTLLKGLNLGVMAGVGAIFVPQKVGLGKEPLAKSAKTALLTVGLYAFGGLCAGLMAQLLPGKSS
jgi:hypothetical protein